MSMRLGRRAGLLLRSPVPVPKTTPRPFAPHSRSYSATESSTCTPEAITLPDNRTLSFARYGTESGYPVLYFHGHPGSRLEALLLDKDARELGASLIAIDRPGIGYSTHQPGRTPTSHAGDVAYLAAELGLKEYKILAVSGGGPYGLACARYHPPASLKAVALLAAMTWLPNVGYRGMRLGNKIRFHATKRMPGLTRWLAGLLAKRQFSLSDDMLIDFAQKQLKRSPNRVPEKDRAILGDGEVFRRMIPSTREHFRQGLDGLMEEFHTHHHEVDFSIEEIDSVPVSLWYGKQDINVPYLVGEELARRISGPARLTILDETHLSLLMNHKRSILEDLLNQS